MNTGAIISKELIRRIFAHAFDGRAFLEDLGAHVLEAFSGIRLIGEIERPEGRETYEELKGCVGQFVNGSEAVLAEVLDYGNKQMRAVFGLYFVWTGIFAYGEESGHELWPQVLEGLGIPQDSVLSNRYRCGTLFMTCLDENHLQQFVELKGGRPYVDRVLLHGLIPDKHIERFIEKVIYPELQSPMGLYKPGDSIVRQWRQDNLTLPKPIQRFIEHGHPVNADVINRFLHMAREWDDDEPNQWQLWGLPKYMVDAFRNFGETTPEIGIRKYKKALASARPFLQFGLETNNFPVLVVPPQSSSAPPQFVLRYAPVNAQNDVEESWAPGNTPIKGLYQTDHLEHPVGPARNGWTINVLGSSSLHRCLTVPYEFLVAHRGDELPLFFFNARSGKLFNARSRNNFSEELIVDNFPEELIVAYPEGASLALVGGQTSIESQALYGEWGDWQYTVCSLEMEGAFEYHGPDATFGSILTECFDFKRTSVQDLPTLSGHNPPSWFRCLEALPIFTAAKSIQIHCRSDIYPLWKRGIGSLTRLDGLERPIRFELAFHQEGQSWTASLPEPLEPGVYELRLQGALGAGDAAYSFVYFPVTRFNAVFMDPTDEDFLVRHFNIEAEGPVDLEVHHNTQLENRENEVVVSPKADGEARAFCAVRAFASSRFPVTILLARRDVRWCRRRESGLIAWEEWLAQPEVLPIQRVDELQDARVAVQMDRQQSADVLLHRPLRLLLKGKTDGTEERDLMSLNASGLRRETHRTWVFDLKKFSDQLKNLKEFQTADIIIDLGQDDGAEILLLSLQRFPEYKDLRLTRLTSTKQTEQYQVAWTPQSNHPTTRRVLSCRPEAGTDAPVSLPLEDGKLPPFVVELPAPRQPAMWTTWVSIQSSRFGQGQSEAPTESQFRWFRTPEGWQDWLAWPGINHKDLDTKIGSIDALPQDGLCSAFPWTYFLAHFHQKTGREAFRHLQAIIGDEVLLKALPIRRGGFLEVKSRPRKCLRLLITETKLSSDLYTCFPDLPPAQWCCFPDNAELGLRLKSPHPNFAGQVWNYQKQSGDPNAIMTSDEGENLDFNIWLEDALDPSTSGTVEARYPFDLLFEPPQLPILNGISGEDAIMPSLSISHYQRPQAGRQNTGLAIGDRISPQMREKMELLHPSSEETKTKAYRLIESWRRWLSMPGLNPLLSRIVSDYLNANSAKALSSIAALIVRLKAHGYEREYVGRREYRSDVLREDTLEFVCSLLPRVFLQELILHEIIISWYWHKSLVTYYEEPEE